MAELDTSPPEITSPPDKIFPTQGDSAVDPLSSEAYQRVLAGETKAYEARQHEQDKELAQETTAFKNYQAREERMLKAEGATMDDIKPWNAQTMAPASTNLWDKFGSPGFVIGMLASSFTAMPMVSALNAGAAAINAINQGDDENYHRAFDTWKTNTELSIKRFNMEKEAFDQIDHLQKNNMAEWEARATALAARFNDQRMLIMLQNGMSPDVIKVREALATSITDTINARNAMVMNDARMQLINKRLGDKSTPEKIIQATKEIDAALEEKGPEGVAMLNVINSPEYQNEKDYVKRNKMLTDAVLDYKSKTLDAAEKHRQLQIFKDDERLKDPTASDAEIEERANRRQAVSSSRSARSATALFTQTWQIEHPKATSEDVQRASTLYTRATSAARTLGTREANVISAINEAKDLAQKALESSKNVPRGNIVPFNSLEQYAARQSSNPEQKEFDTWNAGLITAYSQTMSRTGTNTVEAQKRAIDILSTATGPEAYERQAKVLIEEMEIVKQGVKEAETEILGAGVPETKLDTSGFKIVK